MNWYRMTLRQSSLTLSGPVEVYARRLDEGRSLVVSSASLQWAVPVSRPLLLSMMVGESVSQVTDTELLERLSKCELS